MHSHKATSPPDGPPEGYISLGNFPASDARKILEAFEEADLDFVIETDPSGFKNAQPTDYFTTFGLGVGLGIEIRSDQYDAATSILRTFFPV